MSFEQKTPIRPRADHSVGNIYDRLDAARKKREKILETPKAANLDRQSSRPVIDVGRPFPKLKPPAPSAFEEPVVRDWDWMVPWLLAAIIFGLIFAFAVG